MREEEDSVKAWQAVAGGVLGGLLIGGAALGTAYLLRRRPAVPQGKGVFVRSLIADTPTPESMVAVARDLDLGWVALAGDDTSNQVSTIYEDRLPAYVSALQNAGVQVFLWGWPDNATDGEIEQISAQLGTLGQELDVDGLIINPERPFHSLKSRPDPYLAAQARKMMKKLRAYGLPIGMTSYGSGPPWHPGFPWEAFADIDFGMPQIYDSKHRLPPEYPTIGVRNWQNAGLVPIIPLLGASNRHLPAQMRDIADRTPTPADAVGWWTLDHALKSKGRTAMIRNYRFGDARAVA